MVHQALKTIAKSVVKMRVSDSLYFPGIFDQQGRSWGRGDHIYIYIYIYMYIYIYIYTHTFIASYDLDSIISVLHRGYYDAGCD